MSASAHDPVIAGLGITQLGKVYGPNAADFAIVLARGEERHRVSIVLRFIDELESWRFRQNFVRFFN